MDDLDLSKHLPDGYRKATKEFLLTHWTELAASCYAGYLEEGRGLTYLCITGGKCQSVYLTWTWLQANWDELLKHADPSIQDKVTRWMPNYPPDEECVLLFDFPEANASAVLRVKALVVSDIRQKAGVALVEQRCAEVEIQGAIATL